MNLSEAIKHSIPFNHWELHNCLDDSTLQEIINANIPKGNRVYDGTRAADHTGQGLDGKLRLFVTKENFKEFPYLKTLIIKLQNKNFYQEIYILV